MTNRLTRNWIILGDCDDNEFACDNGRQCIDEDYECDDWDDCDDGSDEDDCVG